MQVITQSFKIVFFSLQTTLISLKEAMFDVIHSLTFGILTWEKLQAIELPVFHIPKAKDDGLILWMWEVVPSGIMMLFGAPLALAADIVIGVIFFSFMSFFMISSGEIYRRCFFAW